MININIKSFNISIKEDNQAFHEFIKTNEMIINKIEYTTEVNLFRIAHVYYKECNHKNIVAVHHGYQVKGEIGNRKSCVVRCADCEFVLFDSKDLGVDKAYEYIEKNKDKFSTLVDLTCGYLNDKYNIKEGWY